MTRTNGEQELVFGNKQLLSAFFVVAILLGVFFTMGYFVGKNSAGAALASGPGPYNAGTRPDAAGKLSAVTDTSASQQQDDSAKVADRDSRPSAADDTSSVAPAPAPTPSSQESAQAAEAKTESVASGEDQSVVRANSEQMYLQVFALRRADADNEVKVLRERGFPALIGESSKKGIYRVLVGPFKTQTEMGHVKSNLKTKGFDSIVAR